MSKRRGPPKPHTHFEQVPLEVVAKLAAVEVAAIPKSTAPPPSAAPRTTVNNKQRGAAHSPAKKRR